MKKIILCLVLFSGCVSASGPPKPVMIDAGPSTPNYLTLKFDDTWTALQEVRASIARIDKYATDAEKKRIYDSVTLGRFNFGGTCYGSYNAEEQAWKVSIGRRKLHYDSVMQFQVADRRKLVRSYAGSSALGATTRVDEWETESVMLEWSRDSSVPGEFYLKMAGDKARVIGQNNPFVGVTTGGSASFGCLFVVQPVPPFYGTRSNWIQPTFSRPIETISQEHSISVNLLQVYIFDRKTTEIYAVFPR